MRNAFTVVTTLLVVAVATFSVLYLRNAAPAAAQIATAEANGSRPFVIKLHARWCPVCMATKGIWSQIETTYGGRVHLVVFDFTNEATAEASRAEATRLGLRGFFDENEGWTGTIGVLDSRRNVGALIHGSRDFAEYQAAIDAALPSAGP